MVYDIVINALIDFGIKTLYFAGLVGFIGYFFREWLNR